MSTNQVGASGDPTARTKIDFKLRASLSRQISQPKIVDSPVGLAVFGDTANIYLAQVVDPGAGVYSHLGNIKAKTYIHGWTATGGWMYVLDGVELFAYGLLRGEQSASKALLTGDEAEKAVGALTKLKEAQQKVEWATLLELAEDEWIRVTAEQAAAAPGSADRDKMDIVAADFFRMLTELREITGSTGGGVAARKLVGDLRTALATERTTAAPWCFSSPVVRPGSFEESQRAIFTVQGDGRLYALDKSVSSVAVQKSRNHAEPYITLIEELESSLRVLAYVSEGKVCVVDAQTLAEVKSWTPSSPPANGTTHSLSAVKNQIWWGTDSAVYGLKVDSAGAITPTWSSGVPWTTRQVGRLNAPVTQYNPPVDPNDLFDTMNVRGWIQQRTDQTASLTDGMLSLLTLSEDAVKYTSPRPGTSYLVHGPFERDADQSRWTQVKPHHSGSMVLLSDNRAASSFCRYSTLPGLSQLVPQWSLAPWLFPSSVALGSALDLALSASWPTAVQRSLSKPHPDISAYFATTPAATKFRTFEVWIPNLARSKKDEFDMLLRLMLWHELFNSPSPNTNYATLLFKEGKSILDTLYDATKQQALKAQFGQPGTQWQIHAGADYSRNIDKKSACEVNFDPPFLNKSVPANLFHSTPPLWYDPWGYNRPGDFITTQPAKTYLDPFCFDGQVRVPYRRITFDTASKVRSWAVFTDNDPSTVLRSVKPPNPDGTPAPEPRTLRAAADPNVFVVSADVDRQRSTLRVLPAKVSRVTFDAADHKLRSEAREVGSIDGQVLAAPVVYLPPNRPAGTAPTGWCVTASDFPTPRLRELAKANADGVSKWNTFLDSKKTTYGPPTNSKTWKIGTCPLPDGVLPNIFLLGFGLPTT
jgi:hypothetical protein